MKDKNDFINLGSLKKSINKFKTKNLNKNKKT